MISSTVSLSLLVSLILTCILLSKDNFFKLFTLKGVAFRTPIILIFSGILFVNLTFLFIDNYYGKQNLQKSQIYFNDDIIRNTKLKSLYEVKNNQFINLNKNTYLFFNKLVLDPLESRTPYIQNPFIWKIATKKSAQKKQQFTDSYSGVIKNSTLQLRYAEQVDVTLNHETDSYVTKKTKIDNYTIPYREIEYPKFETVSISSLSIEQLIELLQIKKKYKASKTEIVFLILIPFIQFIIFPILTLGLSLLFVKKSFTRNALESF